MELSVFQTPLGLFSGQAGHDRPWAPEGVWAVKSLD